MTWVNPFSLMAALYATVGLFFALLKGLSVLPEIPAISNLTWLRVHFITIGTVTQIVFAALPGIAARRFGIADRSAVAGWRQWALLNGGFILILAGLVGGEEWTATLGATLVFTAVVCLLTGLVRAGSAVGGRARESLRFYLTAPVFFLVGITMAVSLLFNWWAPGGRVGVYEAHVHANVWGFLAMLAAGMLFDLFPVLVEAPLARPQWIKRIYWLLTVGAVGLAAGPWLNLHTLTVGGLAVYVVGTAILMAELGLTPAAGRLRPPAAFQLVLSYVWMVVPAFFAPFIVLAPGLVPAAAIEASATQGLVNGWVLGMAMGALPRLLRTRLRHPDHGLFGETDPGADGSWVSVLALNGGVALVWLTAFFPLPVITLAGYGLIGLAWIPFLRRIWTSLTWSGTRLQEQ